jgi:hypothetical protein
MIKLLNPTVLFEYCGGELGPKIFMRMPALSYMYCVGNLTATPLPLDPGDMVFNMRTVKGLYFPAWFIKQGKEVTAKLLQTLSDDLRDGAKIFGTKTAKTVKLSNWEEVVKGFTQIATEGMILIEIE